MLIILAGLPGTGKTTLAREFVRRTNAIYLRIDSIEQAIRNSTQSKRSVDGVGYCVGYAIAEDNLKLGRTVVADSVNPLDITRDAWLSTAKCARCRSLEVELICSDVLEHRQRIESRTTDIPGLTLPNWQDVLDRESHPSPRDHTVIDTAQNTGEPSVTELATHLEIAPPEVIARNRLRQVE